MPMTRWEFRILQHASRCWSCLLPMGNDLRISVCIACLRCSINVRLLILFARYFVFLNVHVNIYFVYTSIVCWQLKDPSDKSKDSDSNENPNGENAKVVPYTKTIKLVTKKHDCENVKDLVKAKHTMELSNESGFPRLKRIVQENPDRVNGPPFVATISEYAILVNYNRLLRENNVHIGLWTVLAQVLMIPIFVMIYL